MKIKEFTIINYRSIKEAYKIQLDPMMTILIGKNNEGKSNVLRALQGALFIIDLLKEIDVKDVKSYFMTKRRFYHAISTWTYDWHRDFPISKQARSKNGKTTFRLVFLLTDTERDEFASVVGHHFNHNLPFEITISNNDVDIRIPKRSYGGTNAVFKKKVNEIARFISERLDSIYIPAIRPAESSIETLEVLIDRELRMMVKSRQEYLDAQQVLDTVLKETVRNLSEKIKNMLTNFIPSIKDIDIDYSETRRLSRRISTEIKIDDGTKTSIFEKGDGLKSLVALSLMQGTRQEEKDLTIAVEEPESHLHPEATRRIKNILEKMSLKNQVIVSTHSPIFVNKTRLNANIIVKNNKAEPVSSISQIRDELGIAVSDNLLNAEFVLFVEGKTDVKILKTILVRKSDIIKRAIENGLLIIHPIGGAKNLESCNNIFQSFLCRKIIAYIDNDSAGKDAYRNILNKKLMDSEDILFPIIPNKRESEIEDLLNVDIYESSIPTTLINWREFVNNKSKKWSDNIKDLYEQSGRNDLDILDLKNKIADIVENNITIAFKENTFSSIESLISLLERILRN